MAIKKDTPLKQDPSYIANYYKMTRIDQLNFENGYCVAAYKLYKDKTAYDEKRMAFVEMQINVQTTGLKESDNLVNEIEKAIIEKSPEFQGAEIVE